MTTDITEVSIDSLLSDSETLDARSFLQRYRKHIQDDVYIANYYANLTPETIDSNFELVKARLVSLKGKEPEKKFSDAPRALRAPRISKAAPKKSSSTKTSRGKSSSVQRMNYVVEFLDEQGHIMDRIGAHDSGDSVHRAEARLAAVPDYARAVYYSSDVLGKDGKPIRSEVNKQDAIANTYKRKGGPAMKNTSSYSSKLEWGGKAKNDHFHFSKG